MVLICVNYNIFSKKIKICFYIDLSRFLLDDIVMIRFILKNNLWWRHRILFIINIVSLLLFWFWLFFKVKFTQEIMPLHYNIYFGIDWFGPSYYLYLYPLLGTFWFLSNMLLAFFWFKQYKKIFYWLGVYTLLLNIFLIFGSFLIILFYYNPS
jgi:hypothetical protein